MRVFITGGTGYLGRAMVHALHAAGHTAIVYARAASSSKLPGTLIDGDVRDADGVRRAIQGADAVIHAAALVSIWRQRAADFDEINVGGLQRVLEASRDAGIRRVVYTSSFLALPPRGAATPLEANDYQRTKVQALAIARAAAREMPLTILFPGVVYGPGVFSEANLVGRLIVDHLQGRLPGLIEPSRPWSYTYVDDVAAAHVAAVERAPVGEFLLGGENAPQMRVFEIVRDQRGGHLPRKLPLWMARTAARIEEARARLTGRPPRLTRGAIDIFQRDWSMDSARSIAELSYRFRPLEDGIRRTLSSIS